MKSKSKIWIPILAAGLVVAICAGALLLPLIPGKEAAVYPVSMVGYTDFYSGTAESYGIVTTDKVQTLYLSGTQTVTEIKVYPGQQVKQGDVLFTYDTTLSDLAIERKDLANQQLEVSLKTAKAELTALNKMKPIVYKPGSGSSSSAATDYSKSPSDPSKLNTVYSTKTTGKSKSSPLYMWLKSSTAVDNALIEYLFSQSSGNLDYVYVVFQTSTGNRTNTEFSVQTGVKFTRDYEIIPGPTDPSDPSTDPSDPSTDPSDPSTDPTEPSSEPTEPSSEPTEPTTEPTEPSAEPTEPTTEPTEPSAEPTEPSSEPTEPSSEPTEPAPDVPTPAGTTELVGYTMTFFTPPSAPQEDSGTVEWNDGYTSAELTALRAEKQAQIKQLEFDIKMGKAELKIMQKEADSGEVTASFAGTVSEILEPAEALASGEPLMKITGGGGYFVEGSVSELALDTIAIGQTVTVTSWDNGTVCTGQIVEIGSYPSEEQSGYYASSETYYPYRVFVDQSADLMEGSYVSMTYQTAQQAAGILYLQNAFIRTEGNRSYVYVRSAEGLLEKRYLECGVSTDGYMTPVYGGITEEDYLAFPYGKDVKEGAPTYEGTDQDLYGY